MGRRGRGGDRALPSRGQMKRKVDGARRMRGGGEWRVITGDECDQTAGALESLARSDDR